MGLSKSEEFSAKDNRLAMFAKALSHPARVAILNYIKNHDSCICGEIVNELPLSQSTVSQHLKELKHAGLIKGTIDGPKTCYCIDELVWKSANDELNQFMQLTKTVACC